MADFESEIRFLNRKISPAKIKWEPRAVMLQVVSESVSDAQAKKIIDALKDALSKKCAAVFHKMVTSITSKVSKGVRVIIDINLLREYFAGDIDSDGGGGGRGLNPKVSQPRPPGSRGI